jgi:hypothetical protein
MDIKNLLGELNAEIDDERKKSMSPADRKLHKVAQHLLLLERDLKAPGAARSADERVERLIEAIAKESF